MNMTQRLFPGRRLRWFSGRVLYLSFVAGINALWRMNETCINVRGQWKYRYRAVDGAGLLIDFLRTVRQLWIRGMTFTSGKNPLPPVCLTPRLMAQKVTLSSEPGKKRAPVTLRLTTQ